MDKQGVWELIDSTRAQSGGELKAHIELLRERLRALAPAEIFQFDRLFNEYWIRAYTWDLWGAAYVLGGGCSVDGFAYFRGWLISKGERVYERALEDPESLAEVVTDADEDCQYEGFHAAAMEAWALRTGRPEEAFPHHGLQEPPDPQGEPFDDEDGDDLERRFPKLSARFQIFTQRFQ